MTSNLQLILGGARSGKSRYALHQGDEASFADHFFLATGFAGDAEMKERIRLHQAQRDPRWKTTEEPYHLTQALEALATSDKSLVVIDCATLWISNLLCGMGGKKLSTSGIEKEFEKFLSYLPKKKGSFRLVSNEVGLGIVPGDPLARQFRDLQGKFNQFAASLSDQVILMTAGLPQKIK